MKRFRVTLMVPQEQVIEALSSQDAHNQVTKMLHPSTQGKYPHPSLHSIEVIEEVEVVFDPDFVIE